MYVSKDTHRVKMYLRLPKGSDPIDIIIAEFSPDFCLDEILILWRALDPQYISLTLLDGPYVDHCCFWSYQREISWESRLIFRSMEENSRRNDCVQQPKPLSRII